MRKSVVAILSIHLREASALLLVQPTRALPEPQVVERVTCTDSSRFFCIKPQNNHNTIFRKSEEVDLAC